MKKSNLTILLTSLFAIVLACGCAAEEGAGVSIMTEVGAIAPQYTPSAHGVSGPPPPADPVPQSDVVFVDTLPGSVQAVVEEFLRFACHSTDGSLNVCESYGIEVAGGYDTSPYAMSSENFMGMVSAFGSQFDEVYMYPDEVASCDRFGGNAKAPAFSGSTQFVLGADGGFVAALDCVASTQYGEGSAEVYFAYSADTRSSAFLTAGLDDPGRGSYIYQGYARRDAAGSSSVIAMSSPVHNLNGSAQRLVFVGNLETHRIALKWVGFGNGGATYKSAYAIGVGGITTDGLVDGTYGLRAEQMDDDGNLETAAICVDNGTRSIVAAADAPDRCSDPMIGAWLDGTSSWDDLAAYLGLTAEDRVVIGDDWGELLGTGVALTSEQVPWDDSELISAID